ncbi:MULTISPECIES: glycosyltransferase [unclassified Thiocapsa]|uniref:glycosyltransferase n=1 Tax=unclassified Thiocapsa TaxID=2641286 RepID=UPI0035B10B14
MKILHVLLSLAPRRGGPVSVITALACAQANAGHQVTICTTNADYPEGVLRPPGTDRLCRGLVEVHYFSVHFAPLDISLSLARYMRRNYEKFDIIHIHGLYRFPSTFSAWLARRYGAPYIICPHGALDPYLYARSSTSIALKRLYERWLDLPNLHGASAVHYTAEDERRLASFLHLRSPSFVVPNGIDWGPFETLPGRGAFRETLAIGQAPLLLFLGRLHHKKGLDILIPAFQAVSRAIPLARLAIVGPSNDGYGDQVRHWVRELALEEAVTFVDFLTGTDLLQAYVDADVFVLPSYTENFGMTVVEAMACELPVVISNRVNIHSVITDAGAGIVTDCDADEFAHAVVALLEDPDQCREMGARGRFAAHERYTWPGIVEALTREYEEVTARVR